jgi:flagellar hook-associated protein 3 FlgL
MINATGNRMTRDIGRQANLARRIADVQVQISTGRRIQTASDDPVAAARVAQVRRAQADETAWASNIDLGIALSADADGVMASVSERLAHARELLVQGASGTSSPADRATIAAELTGLADELNSFAATQSLLGQPLFNSAGAVVMRFGDGIQFAPISSRDNIFVIGGVPIAQTMIDAAGALQAGTTPAALSALDACISHMADVRGDHGVRAARLENLKESGVARAIERAAERSELEDTDLTQAIATLNAQTITLEAAQAAFARINRRTLFDILS